ncbi:Ribonuclease H [Gracilaria domingensis]|nr:Ribonuclease H [Gracilaria domingensis]
MPRFKKRRSRTSQADQGAAQLGPHMTQFKRGSDARPKRKYYAVRQGLDGFTGVVTSWDECKLYVNGVPNAKFKSFKTLDEAQSFLRPPARRSSHTASQPTPSRAQDDCDDMLLLGATDPPPDAPEYLEVYTDGACTKNGRAGSRAAYGVYFGEDNPYNVSEPLTSQPTNQRAEMTAVIEALQIIRQHGLVARNGKVKIYSDSKVSCVQPRFITIPAYLTLVLTTFCIQHDSLSSTQ